MKNLPGNLVFFVIGITVFRFVYGAWPPNQGSFLQWIAADRKAQWSMAVGALAGILATVYARKLAPHLFGPTELADDDSSFGIRGQHFQQEGRMDQAIEMFQKEIALCESEGREADAAPAYASLGKVYFDLRRDDEAEQNLKLALPLYQHRPDRRQATASIQALLEFIDERRQKLDQQQEYKDARYPFSFVMPADWLKEKLLPEFVRGGGRIAISHVTYAAKFNVSVGPLERPEWSLAEVRVVAVKEFINKSPHIAGSIEMQTFLPISGEENVVIGEYETEVARGGTVRRRKNGFLSIVHGNVEYALQWSAEEEYEKQVRAIMASFKFESRDKFSTATSA